MKFFKSFKFFESNSEWYNVIWPQIASKEDEKGLCVHTVKPSPNGPTHIRYIIDMNGKIKYSVTISKIVESESLDDIPKKYHQVFNELIKYARKNYPQYYSSKLTDTNKETGIFEI